MILQELCKLYDRLKDDPSYDIPKRGFSVQKVSFIVVLNPDGTLFDIQDARVKNGKKTESASMRIPGKFPTRTSGIKPYILCDKTDYLFGFSSGTQKLKNFEAAREAHLALREKILTPQFQAVVKFFESWSPEKLTEDIKSKLADFAETGLGVFKIRNELRYVHQIPEVEQVLAADDSDVPDDSDDGFCLVSGNRAKIARLHSPLIKLSGAQSSGAAVVSFNWKAATSYGKENGFNAPVSVDAVEHYCVALNALLKDSRHRFRLGDSTVVFWTGTQTAVEDDIAKLLDEESVPAEDTATLQRIQAFLKNLRDAGTPQSALAESGYQDDAGTRFFMLGLSPNAARVAIRFWYAGTLGNFLQNLREHHRAMRIQPRRSEKFKDPEFISLWKILRQTARDSDGIPPLLGGALLRAVVENLPYPTSLIQLVLGRIRIEGRVDYIRASVLKAFLTRNKKQEITMSLDKTNTNPAYLLGRLFAALEKSQSEAIPGANAGIRERFYASASATPRAVFPIMLRTFPHWIAKLPRRRENFFDKLVQEVLNGIEAQSGFPAHLNLEAQGFFAIGYYHQTQEFFVGKGANEEVESE